MNVDFEMKDNRQLVKCVDRVSIFFGLVYQSTTIQFYDKEEKK